MVMPKSDFEVVILRCKGANVSGARSPHRDCVESTEPLYNVHDAQMMHTDAARKVRG